MTNPHEPFYTSIPGLNPEQTREALNAASAGFSVITTHIEATPKMFEAKRLFSSLGDMEAYERWFLPQVPLLKLDPENLLETVSEDDDDYKNHWISPALARRFITDLKGSISPEVEAYLAHFDAPGFGEWLYADGDADGLLLRDALKEIIEKCHGLPSVQLVDMVPRLMALLWGWEVKRLAATTPNLEADCAKWLETDREDRPDSSVEVHHFIHALTEARCWREHGVCGVDYMFPTFFGAKLTRVGEEDPQ